jgi:hypothetical protein
MLRWEECKSIAMLGFAWAAIMEIVSWETSTWPFACVINPDNYGPYYAQSHECPTFHVFFFKMLATILEKLGDPNWMTAIFTGVLSVSTILLWRSTRDAAIAARSAAEHIPKVERAYLFGGPTNIIGSVPARRTTFDFTIDNAGKTPGILKEVWLVISVDRPTGEPNYPNPEIVYTDIAINAGATGIKIPVNSSVNMVTPFFAYGFFRYVDIFHEIRCSRFCAKIVPLAGKFEIAGGEAWNDWD